MAADFSSLFAPIANAMAQKHQQQKMLDWFGQQRTGVNPNPTYPTIAHGAAGLPQVDPGATAPSGPPVSPMAAMTSGGTGLGAAPTGPNGPWPQPHGWGIFQPIVDQLTAKHNAKIGG